MHIGIGWAELREVVHLAFALAVLATMVFIAIPDPPEKRRSSDA
jgi:hypothetical protein